MWGAGSILPLQKAPREQHRQASLLASIRNMRESSLFLDSDSLCDVGQSFISVVFNP